MSDRQLGAVTLRPHQIEAVQRLRAAIAEHGGALLSDAPGLGKTYTALAVARNDAGAMVIAPASLKAQWVRSAEQAGVHIDWCSMETLSRRPVASHRPLLIVDEAHHLRNPKTRRYARAAHLAIGKRVLLISATPVHNRVADRTALLALFLGAAAASVSESTLNRLIVKRSADVALLPRRGRIRWLATPDLPALGAQLRALPSPLPAADGREALALIRVMLLHAWSSSIAALDAALRRALLQTAAIGDALTVGRWPTRRELRAWVMTDDTSQLAFPELTAATTTANLDDARAQLARHREFLLRARATALPHRDADSARRAESLRAVMRAHPGATIIAFSRYAATVDALWQAMRHEPGVIAITSRGVRSAGGGVRRGDVLAALAAERAREQRLPIHLVLSTDLLGEGLDLRAVSVVVHLDLPWTAARLDQREGRATRLGSPHAKVAVYAVRPPRAASRALALHRRLTEKRSAMTAGLAAGDAREALCALVRPWLASHPMRACTAAVFADCDAFIAVVRDVDGRTRIVIGESGDVTEDDARLFGLLSRQVHGEPVSSWEPAARRARRMIGRWLRRERSASAAHARSFASPIRAVIAQRFDLAIRQAPLGERTTLQEKFASAMRALSGQRGAGVDRLLQEVAHGDSIDAILERVSQTADVRRTNRPATRRSRVLALLLLVRDVEATTGRRSAPRSAASSGTAAPR